MTPQENLLDELFKKANGANFRLCDLHIHTPADISKGYQMGGEEKKISDRDWCKQFTRKIIEEAYRKKLEIIGITDHNSANWIDYFNGEINNVAAPEGQEKIIIFPGFEVNTKTGSGVHIICLFNPGTPKSRLDEYLSALFEAKERFDSNDYPSVTKKDCNEVIDFIQERGGICIGAHAMYDNGILSQYSQQPRVQAFTNPKLLAIEIPDKRSDLTGFAKNAIEGLDENYKRERLIATINSSDANSLDKIGNKATYIKISSLNVEGLRQAFLDWKSRIRLKEELGERRYAKIIGTRWEGGGCFLNNMVIHFNENLNTIIGGKGTGKSTIIETLRYVFDREPKSSDAIKTHQEVIKEVFKSGSTIQVLIYSEKNDKHYVVERSYPGQPVIKSIDETLFRQSYIVREKEILDLSIDRIFLPEIYGQKEIYDISEDRVFQLKLIDRFLEENFQEVENKENELIKELQINKRDIIITLEILDKIELSSRELVEINEKKQKYMEFGIQEKLEKQRNYEKEKLILEKVIEKIENAKEKLEDFFKGIDTDVSFVSDKIIQNLPNNQLLKEGRLILEAFFKFLDKKEEEIKGEIGSTIVKLKGAKGIKTRWDEIYKKQEEEYQKVLTDLQKEKVPLDPEEFMQLERRENILKSQVSEKEKYVNQKKELDMSRKVLLDRLNKVRLEQFKMRQEVAQKINEQLKGIMKVEVEYAALRDGFIEKLLSYSSRENRIMRDPIKNMVYGGKFNVRLFVDSLRKGEQTLIDDLGLTPGTAASLYRAIPKEDYYDIEILDFDPKTIIKLYIAPPGLSTSERNDDLFKETEHLSKGQKCTAILTLILLESEWPLIIDQPEEDLDNRFVVDDVVEKMRREKERRQFIIATHNANITVSADAELILALDADEKHGWEVASGSIDDTEIKEAVEKILEGGRDAFILRKEKYGF